MPHFGEERPAVPVSYTVYIHGNRFYAEPSKESGFGRVSSQNAYTVLQEVLDRLSTLPGKLLIKRGLYPLDTGLTIGNISGISVFGEGDRTILQSTADIDVLTLTGVGVWPNDAIHDTFKDFKIIGFGAAHTGAGLKVLNAHHLVVEGINIAECLQSIELDTVGDSTIYNNLIYNYYHYGINTHGGAENIFLANHIPISRPAIEGAGDKRAISISESTDWISHNVLEHGYGASANGISILGQYNEILFNRLDGFDFSGVYIGSHDNLCYGNQVQVSKSDGIFVTGDRNSLILNNLFENQSYGIWLTDTADSTYVYLNKFRANVTGQLNDLGSNTKVGRNLGFITENSDISTGTGAQQTIAHGLDVTPNRVQLSDLDNGALPFQSAAADAANIYITAVINLDYLWKVWLE